jgi:hypothetical protein
MTTVRAQQRFSAQAPCPICGGHPRLPTGHGVRCFGFHSTDGQFAHCTREELAGDLREEPRSGTFAHRLDGRCRCGRSHGEVSFDLHERVGTAESKRNSPISARTMCPTGYHEVRAYAWTDDRGAVQYETVRYEHLTAQ